MHHPRRRRARIALASTAVIGMVAAAVWIAVPGSAATDQITFKIVRSSGAKAAGCLDNAHGSATVTANGDTETMRVHVAGLPSRTEFDVFVIQVPDAPFGLSWYQGDIKTNDKGAGTETFIGRFSVETFIVAPGSAPAPRVHRNGTFPDASSNPATAPVHTYHLGLWFNSPRRAADAGCPNTVTPFNGVHHAGIQALSTRNFRSTHGPLRDLQP